MPTDAERVADLAQRRPDTVVDIEGSNRVVAADVDGDPSGIPVVLIHGTPDSRLARHPDPSAAEAAHIRLIALDRPGFGWTSADASVTPTSFGTDVAAVLDHLGVGSAHLLAWSAGTIWALGAATSIPGRVRSVTAVGGLVPFEAFGEPEVRSAGGPTRLGMIETAEDIGADLTAEMIAPLLVPDPTTPEAALEHRSEAGATDLATVPGADVQMAAACCDAVRNGTAGLIHDVRVQLSESGVRFDAVRCPTRFVTGTDDQTCPPAFARWYANQIPGARVEIVPDAGHGLLLTHWTTILSQIAHDR